MPKIQVQLAEALDEFKHYSHQSNGIIRIASIQMLILWNLS